MAYTFETLAQHAKVLRDAGLEARSAVRLCAVRHDRGKTVTEWFRADCTIIANNRTVAVVKIAVVPSGQRSWRRVRNYQSLGVPVFLVPSDDIAAFANAFRYPPNVPVLERWRVVTTNPLPTKAPF